MDVDSDGTSWINKSQGHPKFCLKFSEETPYSYTPNTTGSKVQNNLKAYAWAQDAFGGPGIKQSGQVMLRRFVV